MSTLCCRRLVVWGGHCARCGLVYELWLVVGHAGLGVFAVKKKQCCWMVVVGKLLYGSLL